MGTKSGARSASVPGSSVILGLALASLVGLQAAGPVRAATSAEGPPGTPASAGATPGGAPAPAPAARTDAFTRLAAALEGRDAHAALAELGMPVETVVQLVPIICDELRSPRVFRPGPSYDWSDSVPGLVPARTGEQVEDQSRLLGVLRELGPRAAAGVPVLSELMNSEKTGERIRLEAAATLAIVTGVADPGVAFLATRVPKGDPTALAELGGLGAQASEAIPGLTQAISSTGLSTEARGLAASALVRVSGKADPGIPFLLGLLRDPATEPSVDPATQAPSRAPRYIALDALGSLGPLAGDAAPALAALIASDQTPLELRILTAAVLVPITGKADPGVPTLCALLKDPATEALGKDEVCSALGRLGPAAADAVPALTDFLETEPSGSSTRYGAASALSAILTGSVLERLASNQRLDEAVEMVLLEGGGTEPIVQLGMIRLRGNPGDAARVAIAETLGALGAKAAPAVAALQAMLGDAKPGPRIAAASALARITGNAAPGIPALAGLLHEDGNASAGPAIAALADLGPVAAGAVPELKALLGSDKVAPGIQASAARALVLITGDPESGIPALGALVGSPNSNAQAQAISAISALGPRALACVPALTGLLNSDDAGPQARLMAASAIVTLTGSPRGTVPQLAKVLRGSRRKGYQQQLLGARQEADGLQSWLSQTQNLTAEVYVRGLAAVGLSDPSISASNASLVAIGASIDELRAQGVPESDSRLQDLLGRKAAAAADLQGAVDRHRHRIQVALNLDRFQVALMAKAVEDTSQDFLIQCRAADQLGDLGPKAAEAIPDLEALLVAPDTQPVLRVHAASALAGVAGKPGIDALLVLLKASTTGNPSGDDAEALRLTVQRLEEFSMLDWVAPELKSFAADVPATDGRLKAVVEGALFRLTYNSDEALAERMDRILARNHLGPGRAAGQVHQDPANADDQQLRKDSLAALVDLLKGGDRPEVVAAAADTLGGLGVDAAASAPALRGLLATGGLDPRVELSAADALIRVTALPEPAIQVLVRELQGGSSAECLVRLAALGPLAAPSVPHLLALRDTAPDLETLGAVDAALAEIRRPAAP